LNERLASGAEALERALPRLRKQLSKRELVALIRAIHARIAWITEHQRELSEPRRWQDFLAQLARNLYSPSLHSRRKTSSLCSRDTADTWLCGRLDPRSCWPPLSRRTAFRPSLRPS
jgi:hypothetical protein